MCEDEAKLKAAVDDPALLFARMAKYINSPASHTTVLSASDKEGLTNCMAAAAKHTGIVCENMQGLGAKLRKLPWQAKICTRRLEVNR